MDEYDKKFAEMQKYIPFLEAMIERLQNVKDKSREVQLQKMQSLHGILSNSKRKLKIETLQRCEDVLQKLHNKVEKGNTPGLHFPHKKNDASSTQSSTAPEDAKPQHTEDPKPPQPPEDLQPPQPPEDLQPPQPPEDPNPPQPPEDPKPPQPPENPQPTQEIHETPASPSPPVSPDSSSQVAPIIIPTERRLDIDDKCDSKPASPDPIETLPTKAPIIIPTERTSNDITLSPQLDACKNSEDVSFAEWEMLEENENPIWRNKNRHAMVGTSNHDVGVGTKMFSGNLGQKMNDEKGVHVPISMHSSRQLSTIPVPSLGGPRRIPTMLDKNRLAGVNLDQVSSENSRPESPNVPDARLKSPDPEILFPKHGKNTSPRMKDARPSAKPSAPLLLSPPPASTEPPLSIEDLAELLNEEGDSKTEKKEDRLKEDPKSKRDKPELNALGVGNKDPKTTKPFTLSQEDIDSESERRWEEVDKHIVKLTTRKCLPSGSNISLGTKGEGLKPGEAKGPPHQSFSGDNRNLPPSPNSKAEPRFADNYERHPRHVRDNHAHDKDKNNAHNMPCRPEEDMSSQIPMLHGNAAKPDDRNPVLYQRRPGNTEMIPPRIDTEFRMEGPDYFNRPVQNQPHWPPLPPPVNQNEFCNNQWPTPPNYTGVPNSPAQTYQHSMPMPHQEMWNANRETMHMEPPHPNQFPVQNMNTGIMPMMSPNTRPQDINVIPRPDEMPNVEVPNVPTMQPLISPTRFPVAPQYRPYDQPFDRGMEYPHQRQPWDSSNNRSTDVVPPYRQENEVPCVMGPTEGPSGSYPRPSTPCPWNRDRDRNTGRGRNMFYNERNRGEPRNNFNRDNRRPEWSRPDNHAEWDNCNRFGAGRNISERDPRVRMEHGVINQIPNQPRDNSTSVRDPRLAKDKHFPNAAKTKEGNFNERDPRKRSTAATFAGPPFNRKMKEKPKSSSKPTDHRRADIENGGKQALQKAKDKMQSPLESLYGVIDTKAKSAQGYCLQNFKIPKIKRTEFTDSLASSHNTEDTRREKDDTMGEVSSSSDGNILLEDWSGDNHEVILEKKEEPKEKNTSAPVESVAEKSDATVTATESDSVSIASSKVPESVEKSKKEEEKPEESKSKDEVTQEWIESIIRKSFQFGEGKKFVEQAKFMQKLGEVLKAKKLKKIKRIIESESESSSSDKDETPEEKKVQTRKKRRVIVSDSSDEESLAERLGILKATSSESVEDTSVNEKKNEKVAKTVESIEEAIPPQSSSSNAPEKDLNTKEATIQENVATIETPKAAEGKEESKDDKAKEEEPVAEASKQESKEESTEDKETVSKTPRAKAKRRNSLEMLQEDIREMFISDGVVAATGHRQCRTQKENQASCSLNTSVQSSSSPSKKDESSKCEAEESDMEDSLAVSKQKKSPIKPKARPKKELQRVTRQRSKQYNPSSDSEEDQPLALRTELVRSSSSMSNKDTCDDENDALRRSRRIIHKETIKEPRVIVEKTDISKLECFKMMFDSSSDESFGIDVSELAAAVDISLHPEKHPEPEAAEPVEKKKYTQTSPRKSTRRKGSELANVNKDEARFSDEESITSDISMTSSVASSRKTTASSARVETSANEELLSNILVGLVSSKNDADKDSSVADKASDVDADDDASDQLPTECSVKKSTVKKKKKKWQMGILSKKKRKKTVVLPSPKCDSDALNTSSEMQKSTTMDESLVSEDTVSTENTLSTETNKSISEKDEDKDKETNSNQVSDRTLRNQKLDDSSTLSDSTEKKESPSTVSASDETSVETRNENEKERSRSNSEKDATKNMSYCDLDVKELLDYAWAKQERYKCMLCFFAGKNIVHHYKLSHPGKEILISRLNVADAELAIRDAKENDVENSSLKPLTEETCKFRCRICSMFSKGAAKVAMEAFYEHCTTHTGEYRFQCNSCPYVAVAKSSMKTHYYKVCRKFKDTCAEAITEDEIPDENGIYGYLCSVCNFVQLKKVNLEQHIDTWHKDDSDAKIIKINMSLEPIKEKSDEEVEIPMKKMKVQVSPAISEKIGQLLNDSTTSLELDDDDDITEIEYKKDTEVSDSEEKKEDEPAITVQKEDESRPETIDEETKKSQQTEADSSFPAGNLSVFVCPPELEKKEVEIQLERKRKMQEIIQNIGIKLQKDASKKSFSIIDKLKDKMKTAMVNTNSESDVSAITDSPTKTQNNVTSPNSIQSTSTELLPISSVDSVDDLETTLPSSHETSSDKQKDDSTLQPQPLNTEGDSVLASTANATDPKVRDPLVTLGEKKNNESDGETDNENIRQTAPIYDSDSSSESDSELPTDVNMILKETSNINTSCKDPMLTTIQRLAAQLQGSKSLESCKDDVTSNPEEPKKTLFIGYIPKPPDVVPIASIKKFVGEMGSRFHEISHGSYDDCNTPSNFIRLRRLSGDMLSIPLQTAGFPEDDLILKHSMYKSASLPTTPEKMDSVLKSDVEEECSFLKIENVVSLAPRADGAESPIINDIRKAVESPASKNKGVSLLKKTKSPIILRRLNPLPVPQTLTKNIQSVVQSAPETVKLIPVKSLSPAPVSVNTTQLTANYISIAPKPKIIQMDTKLSFPLPANKNTVVTPVTTRASSTTVSPQASNMNYKIVKVVRKQPTMIKPKESAALPMAVKSKSSDAYNAMLKATKLIHLYKCMAQDCRFTSDSLQQYQQHYMQHSIEAEKKKTSPPYDYQNCAYCYLVLEDWNQMKTHIDEKHAHCRYQCIGCFYRAVVPSYVQIHQAISHPGQHGILLGKLVKEDPIKEEVNRNDTVHPYVCQKDCGKCFYVPEAFLAHLRNKHGHQICYKCHLCRVTFVKPEQLLTHYKQHGFYKYQCLYCLYGADHFNEMHSHLSSLHCNRLPQLLERSLPAQSQRKKEVIDQLIIRTADEIFKITEEIIDVENDAKGNAKEFVLDVVAASSDKALYSRLPKELSMVDKAENEALSKSMCNLFGTSTASSSNNASFVQLEKSLNESAMDNSPSKIFASLINDSNVSFASLSNKEHSDRSLLNKSKIVTSMLSDKSFMEPAESTKGTFDCSDEFININLLDNPDFLKKISNTTSDVSMANSSTMNESKFEDSDIEILDIDDTEFMPAKYIKSELERKDSVDSNDKLKADTEADPKDQSCSSLDVKDSSMSVDANGDSSDTIKTDKPLTLDDIKDTGFTGTKLYKCGYETCEFAAPSAAHLRVHLKECPLGDENKNLACAHCSKRFLKTGFLVEHLKTHGLKRFGCSLCKMRCTVGYQAIAHMKSKHKHASKVIPADPKNPSVDGLFIVQPITQIAERKGKKRKNSSKANEKEAERGATDLEKFTFSPDEIESLPRQAIYNREVQCAVCPYTTKVRMNIIRHLQLHAKDETVPESGPVNPVPCLDKKERMFDKMVNLASSSHQNGRMGGKPKEIPKDTDDEFIPKFVPEHKRYVCGVAECNYLTVDEAMLRCHLKALHSEEQYFRCPHCPQPPPGQEGLNIAIDKMGIHLKMHDTRLYKCSHCNHHHYHRHIVERHLSDKHPEKRPFVKVIRELENTENTQQPAQEEMEEELPDPDGNHWKCNICDYKCVYKAEMVNHTTVTHDEKYQYKCNSCPFKTSSKIMFDQHVNNKHTNDLSVDYILIYQRIKGVNKKSTDNVEQSGQDEPFDTTPLWRRDMPRIRHIRGILLEEEDEVSTESTLKIGKRKSDVELAAAKPAKIKPGKSGSLDDVKQTKEKSKRSLSCDKVSTDGNASDASNTADKSKEIKSKPVEDIDFNESDVGRFGPYGKADGNMYVCTLCTQFKTKYKHDMRDHLYRELNYARWHCKECGYLSVNRNALLKHFTKHHNGERPNHEPLSPDNDIEEWVGTLLKKQTLMIKGLLAKQITSNIESLITTNDPKLSPAKIAQNAITRTSKVINISNKSSNMQDSGNPNEEIDVETHDESSKDAEALVIDMKDDIALKNEETANVANTKKAGPEEERKKQLICKHCKMSFTRWRGFKLHVQLTHLKRLGFICPYCDRSTNSETLMRQHIRARHPGCVQKIVQNPAAGGPELPDQFWEKEYGLVFPKKNKKHKRKRVVEDVAEKSSEQTEAQEKCSMCNFTAMNITGLKIHMRIHAAKDNLKCSYCSFTAATNTEIWEHWELNHPFKMDELSIESSAESAEVELEKKAIADDYSNDIEEERVSDAREAESIYYCFYCTFRSKSLDTVQSHWTMEHNDALSESSTNAKSNYPFRYKEIRVSPDKVPGKDQCSKMEGSAYELYLQQSQDDVQVIDNLDSKQEGWICQWCNELCNSEVKMKTHHSMFHSHLPLDFKKQDKIKALNRGYVCPECSFTTTFINIMKNHVSKHINLFKCKYCNKTYSCPAQVASHNTEEHPNLELKIDSIQNYDTLLENIMTKVIWQKTGQNNETTSSSSSSSSTVLVKTPTKNNAVAKKSTTKSSTFRPSIIPHRIKAVARKSTNPHSRFLAGNKTNDKQQETNSKQFSHYGVPRSPVNLGKLNTYMVVGGHRMKVNCTTLAQLININPKIVLDDVKRNTKNIATLRKLK